MLRAALEAQAPPRQNATDTINTLSERLNNSTLLEDRRSAILGLRSFAREFPASVASTSLRGLISSLTRDVEDIDTGKVILETLLNLFNPDVDSPEASEDIALWLADMFSQRQDNITVLLDLLDQSDFYSRLYSLQLLTAISAARPERTQECILSAPLGTTRLVAVLDDAREPVRSAGLVLLNDVTQGSTELQKLVAFEGAFESVFDLIKSEGSLALGGLVVQDCLSLLANLVHLNPSNQNSFRESGFVPRLCQLLDHDKDASDDEDDLSSDPNKEKNLWGFLSVLRMFLLPGSQGASENQLAFVRHGLLQRVLELSFDSNVDLRIRAEALKTCADIIRGNSTIQEGFGGNRVIMHPVANGDGAENSNGAVEAYVIDALLDLTLTPASASSFDVRFAACEVVQAYFHNHKTIRLHFLDRAIYGFTSGQDETSNLLNILMTGTTGNNRSDPYRIWFAALLAFRLTYEEPEAKAKLRNVSEGDAEQGEEVVTCIQSMTGNLISALQAKEDGRIIVGYLMLLNTWLFEDVESVDDLLAEGSTVQSLIRAIANPDRSRAIEQGLIAFLLAILYEYSTKDSPIPRRKLQPLLANGLGKDNLTLRISTLRQSSLLREFEVTPQDLSSAEPGMLPGVYFDQVFVEFFKDNYSRIIRALDTDPGVETARPLDGIDRDLVDSLRAQIAEKAAAHQDAATNGVEAQQKLEQTQAELRKLEQRLSSERGTLKTINDKLHNDHEAEIGSLRLTHADAVKKLQSQHQKDLQQAQAKGAQDVKESRAKFDKEMADLRTRLGKEISEARSKPEKELKDLRNEMRDMRTKHEIDLRDAKAKAEKEIDGIRARAEQAEAELKSLRANQSKHEQDIKDARARLSKDLDDAHKKHERAINEVKALHDKELTDAKGAHQSQLIETQAAHEAELSSARSKHDKAISETSSKHQKELKDLQSKHDKALEQSNNSASRELQQKHEKELKDVEAKHKEALRKASKDSKETLDKKLSDIESTHKQALDKTSKDVTEELTKKHGVELQEVQAKLAEAEKSIQKARKSSSDSADMRKQLEKAEKDLKDAHSSHEKELTEIKKAHDKALNSATSKSGDSAKEMKSLRDNTAKLEKDLAAARKEAKDASEKVTSANASASSMAKLQKDLDAAQKELESAKTKASEAESTATSLKKLEKDLAAARKEADQINKKASEADTAKTELEKELASSRKELEEAQQKAVSVAESNTSASKKSENELSTLQKRINKLEGEAATATKTIEQLRAVNGSTLDKVKERDTKIKTLEQSKHADKDTKAAAAKHEEDKANQATEQTKKLEQQMREQQQKATDLKETVEDLQISVAEKEEARQTAKSELDDLLLVLGDLEEKRARDKKKLKDLGEKTSDDEESEGEDDDDDDDEEEEDENEDEDDGDGTGPRDSDVD